MRLSIRDCLCVGVPRVTDVRPAEKEEQEVWVGGGGTGWPSWHPGTSPPLLNGGAATLQARIIRRLNAGSRGSPEQQPLLSDAQPPRRLVNPDPSQGWHLVRPRGW